MTMDTAEITNRIEKLRPWRYTHRVGDVVIQGDPVSARIHEAWGRELVERLVRALTTGRDVSTMRALDLGCLEGHYTDVLCGAGFEEVVGLDLSIEHLERANFLLRELRGHRNVRLVRGNASDESLLASLGKFDLVLFHGLLYHLKDPLKIFDALETVVPPSGDFELLLSTQYKGHFSTLVSPVPLAELQVKPFDQRDGLVTNPNDGSVFERCSFRLNPAAVYEAFKLYGYRTILAYDTPSGKEGVVSNHVASKRARTGLAHDLNKAITTPGVRFYDWDGRSVDSYPLDQRWEARLARLFDATSRSASRALRRVRSYR